MIRENAPNALLKWVAEEASGQIEGSAATAFFASFSTLPVLFRDLARREEASTV